MPCLWASAMAEAMKGGRSAASSTSDCGTPFVHTWNSPPPPSTACFSGAHLANVVSLTTIIGPAAPSASPWLPAEMWTPQPAWTPSMTPFQLSLVSWAMVALLGPAQA